MTHSPINVLRSMTPDGNVGPRTIKAALESNDEEVKAYIVKCVNAHEALLDACKNALVVAENEGWERMQLRLSRAIALAEGGKT